MIVISVSLVAIGLIVWAIGDNYHYSSDLMSGQDVGSMTPKNGYNIVSFDDSQPVGAKLKLLDHADTNATAFQLKEQHASSVSTIMIFDSSIDDNAKLVADTKLHAAQIAQEKALAVAAAEKANQETQSASSTINASPTVNASVTSTNTGNESVTTTKLNNTNNNLPQTGQETLALTEKVNATLTEKINATSTNTNQTSTNGTSKSVNLDENVGITSQ